jgi:hypothetical protein
MKGSNNGYHHVYDYATDSLRKCPKIIGVMENHQWWNQRRNQRRKMIKKLYDKSPVVWGVIYGEGLFVLFALFEYFLVSTGISECGVIVDSCIRVVFESFAQK